MATMEELEKELLLLKIENEKSRKEAEKRQNEADERHKKLEAFLDKEAKETKR
jgi:hypothetical protein